MSLRALIVSVCFLLAGSVARPDTLTSDFPIGTLDTRYYLTGMLDNGAALQGWINYDGRETGSIAYSQLLNGVTSTYDLSLTYTGTGNLYGQRYRMFRFGDVDSPGSLVLYFLGPYGLIGEFCTSSKGSSCPVFSYSPYYSSSFVSGTVTPASVLTPEPGGLLLLGTGVLGMAGVMRRRFVQVLARSHPSHRDQRPVIT